MSIYKGIFNQNTNPWVSLSPKSHEISLLCHMITVITNQNAQNLQILWENEISPKNISI